MRTLMRLRLLPPALLWLAGLTGGAANAAPDEQRLGRDAGYPVGANLQQAYQPTYLVGSFSAMDRIAPSCTQAPSTQVLVLPKAEPQTTIHYRFGNGAYTLDDYMQHQRATAVVVVRDGRIVAERFNYGRNAEMRMLSNSMGKTVLALGILKALEAGKIRSLEDRAADYVPELKGSLYGGTRLVNLLRMASGARFVEDYSSNDDRVVFNRIMHRQGTLAAVKNVQERAAPQGERFNYSGAQSSALGLVLGAATGQDLCSWIGEQIWQPMGAEAAASWLLNPVDQQAVAQGGFNATVHDYARLGMLLANDGQINGKQIISREHLLDMTEATRQPPAFRPGTMQASHGSTYFGYGYQVWLMPGSHRRFALLGIYGQAIFVDPELKLVMVHTAVGQDPAGDASGTHLGQERDALWRGVVATYGNW